MHSLSCAFCAVHMQCRYPYYYVSKLASDRPMAMRLAPLYSFHASLAKQPICYLYGTTKNTNWHSKSQLSQLHSTCGCEARTMHA